MAKAARKKTKRAVSAKKTRKTKKGQAKAVEYIDCLLELYKLQRVLLTRLREELQ